MQNGADRPDVFQFAVKAAHLDGKQKRQLNDPKLATKLEAELVKAIRQALYSDNFADEEFSNSHGYFSGYKPIPIEEQVDLLKLACPCLKTTKADLSITKKQLPVIAEGWFAVPRWEIFSSSYTRAVEKLIAIYESSRDEKIFNGFPGLVSDNNYLQPTTKSSSAMRSIENQQKDFGILVVPAQFGLLHAGRSSARAKAIMNSLEFGLGAFSVLSMLITHPQRIMSHWDLFAMAIGDRSYHIEFPFPEQSKFSDNPPFFWRSERLVMDSVCEHNDQAHTAPFYGAVTGFLVT